MRRRIIFNLRNAEDATRLSLSALLQDLPDGVPLADTHFRRLEGYLVHVQEGISGNGGQMLNGFLRRVFRAKIQALHQQWGAAKNGGGGTAV